MKLTRVAVIGAGTMGTNIALDFARAGCPVALTDSLPAQLPRSAEMLRQNAAQLSEHGLLAEPAAAVVERVRYTPDLAEAAAGVELVIEAVSEHLPVKQQLFADLEQLVPADTVLASNSSSLMPSDIGARLKHRGRALNAHYWNPAHLIPLVELVPSPETSPALIDEMRALYLEMGKQPIVLKREKLGFIGNRIQFALYREAMALVEEGVATPEEVDLLVRTSLARRLPLLGLFRTQDLGGLDVMLAICEVLYPDLCAAKEAPALLKEKIAQGRLGAKSGAGHYEYAGDEAAEWRRRLGEELIRYARADHGRTTDD